jgi:hypothetical protein
MFAHPNAGSPRKLARGSVRQSVRAALPFALLLLAAGCAAAPPAPVDARDPSNPGASSAPVSYRGVVGPYQRQRPTDPAPWREQNERVAPQEKP